MKIKLIIEWPYETKSLVYESVDDGVVFSEIAVLLKQFSELMGYHPETVQTYIKTDEDDGGLL